MNDLLLITDLKKYYDDRGYFTESFKTSIFEKYGIKKIFVQDNHSYSVKNVIRGLHYQWDKPMDKLVRVIEGQILDIVVDIRMGSSNFGKHYKYILSEENNNQLYIPAGFAHGFSVLSDSAHVVYKCTEEYNQKGESGINPFDDFLKINWEISEKDIIVSSKDKNSQSFENYIKNYKF
jgi:dTDP-4-dehydrorhamnose 3,5-epimerase